MNTPIKAVQFSGTKKQKKKYHVESGGDGVPMLFALVMYNETVNLEKS